MDADSIFKIKPTFLVTQTFDDKLKSSKLSLSMFCEKRLSVHEAHAAAAIVAYDPVYNPEKPFRIYKDRFLANSVPGSGSMNQNEFKAYVSAWIETIQKHNAK